jgi:hypothetical protein
MLSMMWSAFCRQNNRKRDALIMAFSKTEDASARPRVGKKEKLS